MSETETKGNEAKVAKTQGQTQGQTPTNTREIVKKDEESVEERSAYSTEAMLEIAATNAKHMSVKTKELKAKWVEFRDANPGMIGETHDEFDLALYFLAGSVMNDKEKGKNDKYLPNDDMTGSIMVKCLTDPSIKVRMPVTFAIAVAHYMRPFIDSIPDAVKYSVALEREINMRKADSNVFDLGK